MAENVATLPVEIKKALIAAETNQKRYRPNAEVKKKLAAYSILLVTAPTGLGKSTVIEKMLQLDSSLSEVGTNTTRQGRPGIDPPNYRADQLFADLLSQIEQGEITQYTIHSGTHHIYAATLDSYPTKRLVLPTLTTAIEQIDGVGFGEVIKVGLLAPGNEWQDRLVERRSDASFPARLKEARECVRWLKKQLSQGLHFVANSDGQADIAAQTMLNIFDNKNEQLPTLLELAEASELLDEMEAVIKREEINLKKGGRYA
jgi:guanylate kinase